MPIATKRSLTRTSSPPPSLPPTLLSHLSLIPPIFSQAQTTLSNHRKNIVALRKIQEKCAGITEEQEAKGRGGSGRMVVVLVGEKAFNEKFRECLERVLGVKKGMSVADRVLGFVGKFVAYTIEQDELKQSEGTRTESETPSSRFTSKLLKYLLSGHLAKDKSVRYRVTQTLVILLSNLGEIDDDLYEPLRGALLARAGDKEVGVRVQAVLGLVKLMGGEDEEEEEEEDEESIKSVVISLMRFDPSPEVRRAALHSLPLTPSTLPYILSRSRDIDPLIRKSIYSSILDNKNFPAVEAMRVLSLKEREELIKVGLGDREGAFLQKFDLVEGQVAEDALFSLFLTNREVSDGLRLDDDFWDELTPEKAFLIRVFVEHCIAHKEESRLESLLPVVTALAFKIQQTYDDLESLLPAEHLQGNGILAGDIHNMEGMPKDYVEKGFVVAELCRVAVGLDYADEIGRRKMFQLAREMLSQPTLPESLIPLCMNILAKISESERDLIRVIVDVVTEIRLGPDEDRERTASQAPGDDDSMSTASSMRSHAYRRRQSFISRRNTQDDPAKLMEAVITDMRCLLICASLLERVNGTLQDNAVLQGLVSDLIVPALRNKTEPALRDQAIVCLGLCCMIEAGMAKESFALFMQQFNAGDDDLRVKTAQIIFDLLMVHDISSLVQGVMPAEQIIGLIRHIMSQDVAGLQAVAAEGAAKLMLSGMVYDAGLLQHLVMLYLSSETAENLPLRQCLSYFFPVYCYSSPVNQRRMQEIVVPTIELLATQLEEDGEETISMPLAQASLLMVDWTDPSKVVEREGMEYDAKVHFYLANDVAKALASARGRDYKKLLVSLFSKLYMPDQVEDAEIQGLVVLLKNVVSRRPLKDATSRNAMTRFENSLNKRYSEQVKGLDEEELRQNENLKDLWDMIDEISEDDGEDDTASRAGGDSRRARTAGTRARRQTSTTIEEESEEEESRAGGDEDAYEAEITPVPTRRKSARVPVRSKAAVSVVDSESGSSGAEDEEESVDGLLEDEEDDEE